MRDVDLFQLAFGLQSPWLVQQSEFDPDRKRLDLQIDFPCGDQRALPRVPDGATRLHLDDAQVRIREILDPRD